MYIRDLLLNLSIKSIKNYFKCLRTSETTNKKQKLPAYASNVGKISLITISNHIAALKENVRRVSWEITMEEDDDWRQCAEWLNRCQVIPDDHPALGPGGNAINLVQALMDGVALCHLLSTLSNHELDIRSMKDFSHMPQNSQFLCFQNLRLFTQLCEKEFDIPRNLLFQPGDIYHAKNFGKAIAALSKLSYSRRAQLTGIPGFPPENSKLQSTHEYYNNLEEIAAAMDKLPDSGKTNYTQMEEENKEKLYDTVVYQGSKSRLNLDSEPTTARAYCIREIVDTEKNYVDVLKMLIEKYKHPLIGVLSHNEIEEIFKYIEELHTIHREFLSNLSLATSATVNFLSLSDVFLKSRDNLLIYGEYCGHLQHAQNLVYEIMRNDVEKRNKIELCQSNSEKYNKFALAELLTIPIQRVLKYHLLLEHLCKLTPADHYDRPDLVVAHEAMREVALSINDVKRDLDTISSIDQIQSSLLEIMLPPDKRLSSYGHLHMDGEVKVLSESESKAKTRYLFLFDKILIVCKPKGDSFTFMFAYHVVNGQFQRVTLPNKKGYSFGFTLPILGDRDSPNLTFFTKSEELRTSWMKAVMSALSNLCPPGAKDRGYNFEMFTFKQPTYCCICNKLITGVFFQGYRCRETNRAAHKACLANHNLPLRGVANPHINGIPASAPPPLPPQISTVRSRRSNVTMGSTPCTPANNSLCNSESFDFSQLTDTLSSVNQWLASDHNNLSNVTLQRNRRISSGLPISSIPTVNSTFAVARKAYDGDPLPPSGSHPLRLSTGDQVELTKWTEGSSWWQGYCNGSEGWFPANVVEIVNSKVNKIGTSNTTFTDSSSVSLSNSIGNPSRHSLPPDCSISASNPKEICLNFDPDHFPHQHNSLTNCTNNNNNTNNLVNSCLRQTRQTVTYVGEMDRLEAVNLLSNCIDGTFLVRLSKSAERMGEYSLSVVYGHPRHIRIQRFSSPDSSCITYGLCELEHVIDNYSKVSLNRCFDEVDITLLYPYQKCPSLPLFYVRANFDFHDKSNSRFLNLKGGDRIAVVSRAAEDRVVCKYLCNIEYAPFSFFPNFVVINICPFAFHCV
ncbi:Guanine nucleotide exchange factor VAV2 [Schistosoma japonicum]|nr:Guanine nucleotide exchange factor VAV2 [Schistosoma japonicum]